MSDDQPKPGISVSELASTLRRMGPLMPELPVPSRWAAFKRWIRVR